MKMYDVRGRQDEVEFVLQAETAAEAALLTVLGTGIANFSTTKDDGFDEATIMFSISTRN